LGCFFDLGFAASAGHVCKSVANVCKSEKKCRKVWKSLDGIFVLG
jgi:hypothetical protein